MSFHIHNLPPYNIADTLFKQLVDIVPSISARQIIEPIALGLEYIGVAIIVYGAVVSLTLLVKADIEIQRKLGQTSTHSNNNLQAGYLQALSFLLLLM